MTAADPSTASETPSGHNEAEGDARPFVTLALAGLNEAAIVQKNFGVLCDYMTALEDRYRWEMVFVNDGSTDGTGQLAEEFAADRSNITILHHPKNFGLGQALRYAFDNARGDYIVVLDLDLSYGPESIPLLVDRMRETGAKIVATSPYIKGGRITNVPWFRKALTIGSNWFLSTVARGGLSSLTPMVRAYDRRFLQGLDLQSTGMDINLEIIYKAMMLNARIEEVPAHLDWSAQRAEGDARKSKMKIMRHTLAVLVSGFLFRPVLFFIVPGLIVLAMSLYATFWAVVHTVVQYRNQPPGDWFLDRFDAAVAAAFDIAPHAFIVGGLALLIAMQLLTLGIVALQSTRYFEQLFHLGSSLLKEARKNKRASS